MAKVTAAEKAAAREKQGDDAFGFKNLDKAVIDKRMSAKKKAIDWSNPTDGHTIMQ